MREKLRVFQFLSKGRTCGKLSYVRKKYKKINSILIKRQKSENFFSNKDTLYIGIQTLLKAFNAVNFILR